MGAVLVELPEPLVPLPELPLDPLFVEALVLALVPTMSSTVPLLLTNWIPFTEVEKAAKGAGVPDEVEVGLRTDTPVA
jgi:hypothetical protein